MSFLLALLLPPLAANAAPELRISAAAVPELTLSPPIPLQEGEDKEWLVDFYDDSEGGGHRAAGLAPASFQWELLCAPELDATACEREQLAVLRSGERGSWVKMLPGRKSLRLRVRLKEGGRAEPLDLEFIPAASEKPKDPPVWSPAPPAPRVASGPSSQKKKADSGLSESPKLSGGGGSRRPRRTREAPREEAAAAVGAASGRYGNDPYYGSAASAGNGFRGSAARSGGAFQELRDIPVLACAPRQGGRGGELHCEDPAKKVLRVRKAPSRPGKAVQASRAQQKKFQNAPVKKRKRTPLRKR